MKILAVSTSSKCASVALLENDNCIKEINSLDEKTHSEKFMPLIDELLNSTNTSLSDINLIAVDNGPGSFTGIRIGIATIKAIAEFKNIPVVSCSSLEALAYNASDFDYVASVIDARNNQVYAAVFDKNYNIVSDFFADDVNTLIPIFQQYKNIVFVGDGAHYLNVSYNFGDTIHSANVGICGYKKYLNGLATNADNLSVMYLRPSQAERLRKD